MLEKVFTGLFDTTAAQAVDVKEFLICVGFGLVLGVVIALSYAFRSKYSKSFLISLCVLPAIVSAVIMMVNGNIGAGVAVAGAFSLVRFRSAAGSAKEIAMIFLAMTAGLIAGMGYLGYGLLFTVVLCVVLVICNTLTFGKNRASVYRTVRITIPEDLDYTDVFDPILKEYARDARLMQVKTVNMGSMFKLTYDVTLRQASQEKEMIDKLRCRNGNLEISVSNQNTDVSEL